MDSIEVQGAGGESLVYDGATVAKFRHHGKEESVRNPVSTFRQVQVKPRKLKRGQTEQEYDLTLAMGAIMTLRVPEAEMANLERLLAALQPS